MGAEMDQRVDGLGLAQPEVERHIERGTAANRVVVVRLAVERIAAVGLNGGDELSEAGKAQSEMLAVHSGVVFGRAQASSILPYTFSPSVAERRR